MTRPVALTPVEAHGAIQRILERFDSISLTDHARQRARERHFTIDDIRRVLLRGTVGASPEWSEEFCGWKYVVSGLDYDNVPLEIVVAIEPTLDRITVITGQDPQRREVNEDGTRPHS